MKQNHRLWDVILFTVTGRSQVFPEINVGVILELEFKQNKKSYTSLYNKIVYHCKGKPIANKINLLNETLLLFLKLQTSTNITNFLKILVVSVILQIILQKNNHIFQIDICNTIYDHISKNYIINDRFWEILKLYETPNPTFSTLTFFKTVTAIFMFILITKRLIRA